MIHEYAVEFARELQNKYERESVTNDLTLSNPGVKFINAQTIKLPTLTLSGYKNHNRNSVGMNAGTIDLAYEAKTLSHDRDIEFYIDAMDIDETNLALEVAQIHNTFETEQAIPEKDAYRLSKLYADYTSSTIGNKTADTTVLTSTNILSIFDKAMEQMDDAGVPTDGRILYVTPAVNTLLKEAQTRQLTGKDKAVVRSVYSIDDVVVKVVPSGRMKTEYDFTTGFVAKSTAGQINMILIHPSCVVCRDRYSYIKIYTPGTDSRTADSYLYQNRNYGDLFLIKAKVSGCFINITPATTSVTGD